MQLEEVIRCISITISVLFFLFLIAPWLYQKTVLAPIDVDTEEWVKGSYQIGALIVSSVSLIAQILWLTKAIKYDGDDREAMNNKKYWYLGLFISVLSIPIAIVFTTFREEGSWEVLPSLIAIFALAVAAIYWLATAISTPGALKFIVPYSLDIRRFLDRF